VVKVVKEEEQVDKCLVTVQSSVSEGGSKGQTDTS
jgi:hypothetical protein